jgi:arsenite methyltransferase
MTENALNTSERPDYGLDAPGLVRFFLFGGSSLFVLGLIFTITPLRKLLFIPGLIALYIGLVMGVEGILMLRTSYVGKFRARDRLLDDLHLRGDETVLDMGCGHGLLLIGAAQRLSQGHAIGVDIWSQVDQGKNSKTATLHNARIEGVADRVVVLDADMRRLPFEDSSIDVVVASLSIHNIKGRDERRKAIREMARVLKPAGKVALLDLAHAGQYAADLRAEGLQNIHVSPLSFGMFPPVRTVTARKD